MAESAQPGPLDSGDDESLNLDQSFTSGVFGCIASVEVSNHLVTLPRKVDAFAISTETSHGS